MFKLSIKIKVLSILLLLTVAMIVSMAIIMHSSFNKGFFKYRKALEKQFNDNVVSTLENYYKKNGSWYELNDNKRLWHDLINQSSVELLNENQLRQPPRHPPDRHLSEKPPIRSDRKRGFDNHNSLPNQRKRQIQLPPISLYDADKKHVVGMRIRKNKENKFTPIKFNSTLVGYLVLQQNNNVHFKQDKNFADGFRKMLVFMGFIMAIIAIIITFPIASYFTRLINQISQATKKVAAGDFSTRINTNRKDELGELAAHFNVLAKTLESNSESQKRMIADVAHELRTPISVIMGEIEAIQDGIHDANEDTLSLLHSQISSLKNLVNDLYELSESDLGSLKYKMRKIDAVNLINQSYLNHKLRFEQKNISLKIELPTNACFILGDLNRLNQLFNNILSNTLQYTDEGGIAKIDVMCNKRFFEVKVSDSAPGLELDQLDKIFDRLYRADQSRSKNTGGSGLGLSICKEIVKAHNGFIKASFSHLGGIEMLVQLPKIDSK